MSILDFAIVGAQKSGTTALVRFLSQHPGIAMSEPKEVHLFDARDFKENCADIENSYQAAFQHATSGQLKGEATPVYMFFPEIAAGLSRYNPDLKIIVLLRNPVDRAFSHYLMEFERRNESESFAKALLLESRRIRQDTDPRDDNSALRRHSYRSRGLYSRQLASLYAAFPPNQILLVHSEDLLNRHHETLARIFRFLTVEEGAEIPPEIVFATGRHSMSHPITRFLLKTSYLVEYWRIKRYVDFSIRSWIL